MDASQAVSRSDTLEYRFFHDDKFIANWVKSTTSATGIGMGNAQTNVCTRDRFLLAVLVAMELQCTEDLVNMLTEVEYSFIIN